MAPATDWAVIAGYAERLSVRPGEDLRVMVSCAGELAVELVRLPGRQPADATATLLGDAGVQPVRTGSHVEAGHHAALRPVDGLTVSTWIWLAPGAPSGSRRALLASWGPEAADGWALCLDAAGRPCFEVAAAGRVVRATCARPLPLDTWTRLEGVHDAEAEEISIARYDRGACELDRAHATAPGEAVGGAAGPMTIGAERRGPDAVAQSPLDGKLEAPAVAAGSHGERALAAWALGEGREHRVPDAGPLGLDGRCVNGPLRAVTGHSWRGEVHDWRFSPGEYQAMHFHSDATDDLDWEPTLELAIGEGCESGVHAVLLRCGEHEDVVPFVVRRGEGPAAANVVLLPTFTYLAYSCERDTPRAVGSDQPLDQWVAGQRLRSLYDRYDDGCGVYEASLLRPLTQLRPGYRCPQHGGPHGLAQDLVLLGYLERRRIAADVITDHDVHREGAAALADHRTVITGAHPEYATAELIDALETHVDGGGALAYLGGNGLNGTVSVDPARPHVLELRRTETQGLAWQALPGEHHHAASGDFGGDWRRRDRPEHRFLGVGLSAFGVSTGASYERVAEPGDPAAEIVFEGLDPQTAIGHPGVVVGAAAGFEVDNHDPLLGSPDDADVLASASLGSEYSVWPDDVRDTAAAAPKRRADMVLRRTTSGGTVFSVGSIAWSGCLGQVDSNPVARITENVLRELARERPFEAGRDG